MRTALITVEIVAASVWIGSLACLAVVSAAARAVLDGPAQVAFFRGVGRRYGTLGTAALVAAIAAGLALAWPPSSWTAAIGAAVALSGVLVLVTLAGMAQARAMTRLRARSFARAGDAAAADAVRRGRRVADTLRGALALLTLAVVVLAAHALAA